MGKLLKKEKKIYGTGSGVYYRWGSKKCPQSPMLQELDTGYTSSTTGKGIGGSSAYMCLGLNAEKEESQPNFGHENSGIMAGVRYGMMDENPFDNADVRYYYAKGVPCAICHLTNRTLIHVFPAEDKCPDEWIYEYSGYIMAGSNIIGSYICVDENPEAYQESDEPKLHSLSIVHIGDMDGGLRKPPYEKKAAIRCVVCSK